MAGWRVVPDGSYGIYTIAGASFRPIIVTYAIDLTSEDGERRLSDARKMAAAPEMLSALQGLETILARAESNASGNPEWEAVSGRINAARAAIAKATGAA